MEEGISVAVLVGDDAGTLVLQPARIKRIIDT